MCLVIHETTLSTFKVTLMQKKKIRKNFNKTSQFFFLSVCWTKRDLHVMVRWSVFLLRANILNIKDKTRGQRGEQFALKLLDFPVVPNSF